jgi:hypothetical protein
MSDHLYLLTITLPLATLLLIFGMRYFSATQQAKTRLATDEAYRQVAQKAVTTQSETAMSLASIQAALEDVRTHLAAVEKILKQVE